MDEFYPQIRAVHIWSVTLSGLLFALRGGASAILEAGWPKMLPLRLLSWTLDTTLLTAALMLTTIVGQYPLVDAWLTVKVILLVVYIGLGVVALSPRQRRPVRIACWITALAVFGVIVSVARAHHPLGLLAPLAG